MRIVRVSPAKICNFTMCLYFYYKLFNFQLSNTYCNFLVIHALENVAPRIIQIGGLQFSFELNILLLSIIYDG